MKGELLILFVILLLGLILCSFLGGKGCGMEGFTAGENTLTFMAPDGSKAVVTVGDNITGAGGGTLEDALALGTPLSVNTTFTIEVVPPTGAVLQIERTTPAYIDTIMNLR